MRYFELKCKAYLKSDIEYKGLLNSISKYINFSLMRGGLEEIHLKTTYKHYCFDGFTPIEKDKIYKKGSLYSFNIRSFDESFINILKDELRKNINNEHFLVIETTKKDVIQKFITEFYSTTPVISTIESKIYWTIEKSGDIFKLQKLLHENLEKKYNDFFKEKLIPTQNFIQLIEIKNQKPLVLETIKDGKTIKFFGNKFRIIPNEDDVSQKLAFTALACGLGEKNSFGAGFCVKK